MRWQGNRQSNNVEDRREAGSAGGGGFQAGRRGIGLGGLVLALLGSWLLGINPMTLLGLLSDPASPTQAVSTDSAANPEPPSRPLDLQGQFVSTVLADTEDVWAARFREAGRRYEPPRLVLFRGRMDTACGMGEAAMGPFYCPGDRKVYIDLSFYEVLQHQLGAPGDFAQAYVIAHEVGHHVQNLLGLNDRIERLRGRGSERRANQMSVRVELQADCYAGVWAFHANAARQLLEQGDLEEALNAASRIGDDALQRRAGGPVVVEQFTHGSSAQRKDWFQRGMSAGRMQDCDTFGGAAP